MSIVIEERKSVLAEEASFKLIAVEKKDTLYRRDRDGRVPWYTEILPILRGNTVTKYQVYQSIINTYGKDSISEMRTYKFLESLVEKNIATKSFDFNNNCNAYTISK